MAARAAVSEKQFLERDAAPIVPQSGRGKRSTVGKKPDAFVAEAPRARGSQNNLEPPAGGVVLQPPAAARPPRTRDKKIMLLAQRLGAKHKNNT